MGERLGRIATCVRTNAIALAALFVALGGTATALQRNSVGTPQLKDNAVKTKKIAGKAVTKAKLAPALGGAGEVITAPQRRRIQAPAANGFNQTVLHESGPFKLTGRCTRNAGGTNAAVYIEATQPAMSLPIGNPPMMPTVQPGAPRLVAPPVSSRSVAPASTRGAAAVWAITESGRYVNLSTFVAREQESGVVSCTFGVAGFAN